MSEPKTFASLSSSLLARKGAAKPAMRPQGFGHFGGGSLEDLGWNDMHGGQAGHGPADYADAPVPEHVPSSITALTPAPRSLEPVKQDLDEPRPVVVQQLAAIEASFSTGSPVEEEPAAEEVVRKPAAAVVPIASRQRAAPGSKAKAAFTLRLEAERHLKLRLACAVTRRSAQQIVTEALDAYLKSVPGIEALAQQVPANTAKSAKRS